MERTGGRVRGVAATADLSGVLELASFPGGPPCFVSELLRRSEQRRRLRHPCRPPTNGSRAGGQFIDFSHAEPGFLPGALGGLVTATAGHNAGSAAPIGSVTTRRLPMQRGGCGSNIAVATTPMRLRAGAESAAARNGSSRRSAYAIGVSPSMDDLAPPPRRGRGAGAGAAGGGCTGSAGVGLGRAGERAAAGRARTAANGRSSAGGVGCRCIAPPWLTDAFEVRARSVGPP